VGPNPAAYPQRSDLPTAPNADLADGQWHSFGPQAAPALRVASPQNLPTAPPGELGRTYSAHVGDGQWHHFGPQPAPALRASSPQSVPKTQTSEPVHTYKVALQGSR
jgi:hypothetical protein